MDAPKVVMWNFGFYACCAWLLLFVFVGSVHDYEFMLGEAGPEIKSWCQLPVEKDPVRGEMYALFLVQLAVVGLIFLRRKNPIFLTSLSLVFCYATYVLVLKDIICTHFYKGSWIYYDCLLC